MLSHVGDAKEPDRWFSCLLKNPGCMPKRVGVCMQPQGGETDGSRCKVWPMITRRSGLSHRLLLSLSAAGLVLALNTQTSALDSAGLWAQHNPQHLLISADKALKLAHALWLSLRCSGFDADLTCISCIKSPGTCHESLLAGAKARPGCVGDVG